MRLRRGAASAVLVPAIVAAALSPPGAAGVRTALAAPPDPAAAAVSAPPVLPTAAPGCDPIGTAACLLPFPNDWYTVADRRTATHRRVAFTRAMMPRNRLGLPVDPAEFDRNDGFSPGGPILAQVPALDLTRTGAAPIHDIGRSLQADAPIVVLDARTRRRIPYFAELDSRTGDPQRRALIVRPARRLDDGAHYIVALRGLRDASGAPIAPAPAFAAMLGVKAPADSRLAQRWRSLRPVLSTLRRAGVDTSPGSGLYLAWDFTTSSTRSLTERVLHMRDEAFRHLGKAAPTVLVTSVKDTTAEQDPQIARRVSGVVLVPDYLDQPLGGPGSRLNYASRHPSPDALPSQVKGRVMSAGFQCDIPRAALSKPARPVLFGHGLFQNQTVVDAWQLTKAANDHDVIFCASNWLGMSAEDLPFLGTLPLDLSRFPSVPDRMQQAYLNFLFLGRWMDHPKGMAASWFFRMNGRPLVDTSPDLVYAGYSLGGIQGAALTALAQDWRRSWLGVPGIEFATMLNRSSDFARFQQPIDDTYPDPLGQQLILGLLQMVWDRGEGDGYITHVIRDPLPHTPVHQVLIHAIYGDHQVANVSSQIEARTLGIPVRGPILDPGRDDTGFWGVTVVPASDLPYQGSMLTMWDSGSPTPPEGNLPPSGHDPHNDVAGTPAALDQVVRFFEDGTIVDTCSGLPCKAVR